MSRYIVILRISASPLDRESVQRAMSQEDIERTLTRAQTLYYEAQFKDSVDLLLPVDAALRQQPAPVGLSISVKLQLALGYIGQNQTDEAKSVLQEVCVLDPEYSLDSNQFAPKVIALFDDVKAKQKQRPDVRHFCREIDRLSKSGDVAGTAHAGRDRQAPAASAPRPRDAAEVLFKQGLDAYKQENFARALEKLRGALKFRPDHDLAIQYAELAECQNENSPSSECFSTGGSILMLVNFRRLQAFIGDSSPRTLTECTTLALEQIRAEYRKAVSSKVESWNQSCSTRTPAALDTLRQETRELLPDPAIAARPGFETGSMRPGADCSAATTDP